jgi:hypothetical protein
MVYTISFLCMDVFVARQFSGDLSTVVWYFMVVSTVARNGRGFMRLFELYNFLPASETFSWGPVRSLVVACFAGYAHVSDTSGRAWSMSWFVLSTFLANMFSPSSLAGAAFTASVDAVMVNFASAAPKTGVYAQFERDFPNSSMCEERHKCPSQFHLSVAVAFFVMNIGISFIYSHLKALVSAEVSVVAIEEMTAQLSEENVFPSGKTFAETYRSAANACYIRTSVEVDELYREHFHSAPLPYMVKSLWRMITNSRVKRHFQFMEKAGFLGSLHFLVTGEKTSIADTTEHEHADLTKEALQVMPRQRFNQMYWLCAGRIWKDPFRYAVCALQVFTLLCVYCASIHTNTKKTELQTVIQYALCKVVLSAIPGVPPVSASFFAMLCARHTDIAGITDKLISMSVDPNFELSTETSMLPLGTEEHTALFVAITMCSAAISMGMVSTDTLFRATQMISPVFQNVGTMASAVGLYSAVMTAGYGFINGMRNVVAKAADAQTVVADGKHRDRVLVLVFCLAAFMHSVLKARQHMLIPFLIGRVTSTKTAETEKNRNNLDALKASANDTAYNSTHVEEILVRRDTMRVSDMFGNFGAQGIPFIRCVFLSPMHFVLLVSSLCGRSAQDVQTHVEHECATLRQKFSAAQAAFSRHSHGASLQAYTHHLPGASNYAGYISELVQPLRGSSTAYISAVWIIGCVMLTNATVDIDGARIIGGLVVLLNCIGGASPELSVLQTALYAYIMVELWAV